MSPSSVSASVQRPGIGLVPQDLPAASPPVEAGGANLRELIAILARRRRSIALAALIAGTFGLAYVLMTPKTYTSTVSILIDGRARTPIGAEPVPGANNVPDAALIESQVRLIASDAILRRVVEHEKLGDDPAYGPAVPGMLARLTGATVTAASPEDRSARALGSLRRNVLARRSDRTYVMDVDVVAADGPTAARLANAVASAYIADQADSKVQAARRDGEALNARLTDLQQRLAQAETKVQDYKARNQIFDANGRRINEQELADGTTALSSARTKASDAKARLDQIQRIIASGRPVDAVGEALKSPAIDRLRSQYAEIARQEANFRTTLGDRHPALIETVNQLRRVRGLIDEELKRVAAGAANEYQAARASEAAVQHQVTTLKASANVTSQASVELRELEHEVDASKAVYEKFLRARETVGETGLDGPVARIIAPAIIPASASAPKSVPIVVLSVAAGLFVGIAHAFFAEYLAQGAPLPAQTGLPKPALATPPPAAGRRWNWLKWRGKVSPQDIPAPAVPAPPRPAPEGNPAISALLQDLLPEGGLSPGQSPLTILVTSAEASSGKTATAIDLAFAAARTGERVLLMDADAMDPALDAQLDLMENPELIELNGTFRPCYRAMDAGDAAISVVPMLAGESRLVQRLLRGRAKAPIAGIASHFTLVILDGGTIGEDETCAEVASAADYIVLVTRLARISQPEINRAMQALQVDEDRFGGAVCNAAPLDKAA